MNFRKAKKEAKKHMRGLKWRGNIAPRYIDNFVCRVGGRGLGYYELKMPKDSKKKRQFREELANMQKGSRKRRRLEKIKAAHDKGIFLSAYTENLKRDGLYSGPIKSSFPYESLYNSLADFLTTTLQIPVHINGPLAQ